MKKSLVLSASQVGASAMLLLLDTGNAVAWLYSVRRWRMYMKIVQFIKTDTGTHQHTRNM